mmetsp:Transcript_5789/g.9421  ORF Transcript_5789/g.9421 Transcript_5789/m.9421 type:complete len:814 (+) Transcript_5789:148-2589(+)
MDGIHFEPNLFRDLNQYPADSAPSSSPRATGPGARLAENAKIFALLLASSNKHASGADQLNISRHHSEQQQLATQFHSPAKTALKVSFKPSQETSSTNNASSVYNMSANGDPFSPAQHMYQELQQVGDSDPHASGGYTAPPLSPTYSSSYPSRKRPRTVDTVQSSRPHCHGPNRQSHFLKAAPPTCSTPLSRFIELYEHDEHARGEGDDMGDHEDGEGHGEGSDLSSSFVSSPTSSSMLHLLQTRSPKSTDTVDKSQRLSQEGSPKPRKYFTFDTMHTAPTHTGPSSSSGPSDSQDPDLDSILQCFALTPLAPSPRVNQQVAEPHPHPTTTTHTSSTGAHDRTNSVDLSLPCKLRTPSSVTQDFEDEHIDAGSLSPAPLQTMLQPLQAKLGVVLHPTKLSGDSLPASVPTSSLPTMPSSSSSLPPLPPCFSTVYAPPASFDLLLSNAAHPSVVQQVLPNKMQIQMQKSTNCGTFHGQLRERLNCRNGLQSTTNKHSAALSDRALDDGTPNDGDQDPSLESICRWLCEKYCPAAGLVSTDSNGRNETLLVQVSDVATAVGCTLNKILRIFNVLDVFKLVRQTSVKPLTFQWLARSRVDLMRRLENMFAQLQADVLAGEVDGRDGFWQGVAALDICRDAEAQEGNVHCLPQNRTLPFALNWVERSVVCQIMVRHLVADTLVGHNSHCHPDKDVSQELLASLSSQTRLSCHALRQHLKDITTVLSGLDVLQQVPVLMHLLRPGGQTAQSAPAAPKSLKSTFRWIFPLDYLTIFYRHEQKNAQAVMSRARQSDKQRKTHSGMSEKSTVASRESMKSL